MGPLWVRSQHVFYKLEMRGIAIGPVAQWIRHRPTEPGIAGSSHAGGMSGNKNTEPAPTTASHVTPL